MLKNCYFTAHLIFDLLKKNCFDLDNLTLLHTNLIVYLLVVCIRGYSGTAIRSLASLRTHPIRSRHSKSKVIFECYLNLFWKNFSLLWWNLIKFLLILWKFLDGRLIKTIKKITFLNNLIFSKNFYLITVSRVLKHAKRT